jgi:hypothetical protein
MINSFFSNNTVWISVVYVKRISDKKTEKKESY